MAILLSKGHGTGFSSETIHIVNPENFTEYPIEKPLDIIKNNVTTKIISDTEVDIKIGETISNIKLENIPFKESKLLPDKISEISYENFIYYGISDNTITTTVGVEGDYLKYIEYIAIEYYFKDGKYKMKNISISQN
ncbi:hypothetical protein [Brevibacillus porteri]|uniref:Uncharacterized protein n=1 Tax=Brevibacillus porteri TaxID=2126350 RepID=A0ABX5FP32_9BACL|nr:hypothetical protein [Brevibacillus porteri]MED1799965.1 hypothetical protein [Brevibacillus porteri]MED2132988.1 hypothetical protein [Brevibacillus porteri]MED2744100.1 hypothetical protein [Brevibacillus porteri]MED2816860.1 hypothetical protein [Brevibacillus porteri]MED2894435.1 hypothetical protein [Brevibacillus porteri]